MSYHLIKMGSRPLMAIPCATSMPSSLRATAIRCYPAHTGKKKWVRKCILLLSRLGLLRWVFPEAQNPIGGVTEKEFQEWVDVIRQQLDQPEIFPVFVWPADPNRGRIYVYILDSEGEQLGFCKLGLDQKNNRLIEREALAMAQLEAMGLSLCRVPKLILSGAFKDHSYVLIEISPPNTRAIDWRSDPSVDALIDEYSGPSRRVLREEIDSLDWWNAVIQKFSDCPKLLRALNAAADQGVEVCRVHGDLNRTNILLGEGESWILDWEQSHESGPSLTDRICVVVDTIWLESSGSSVGILDELMTRHPELQDEKTRGPGLLALAFLGAAGFTPVLAILSQWFPNPPSH